jgi:hypothetical protein
MDEFGAAPEFFWGLAKFVDQMRIYLVRFDF